MCSASGLDTASLSLGELLLFGAAAAVAVEIGQRGRLR